MNTLAMRFASQLDDVLFEILHGCQIVGLPPKTTGKWSATENLAHLARYHEIFAARLERILNEHEPDFARYRAEEDDAWGEWRTMTLEQLLPRIREMRAMLSGRVQSLGADDLERVGIHPAFGPMRLRLWIEFFLIHEAHHLYAILQRTRGA